MLLADVGLEFGMKMWSKRLIDEILPQVNISSIMGLVIRLLTSM